MVKSGLRVVALLVGVAGLGACAHTRFKAPDDPVEEARLLLSDVAGAQGDVVCASAMVDQERALTALKANGPRSPSGATNLSYRGRADAAQQNLSQVSAAASSAWEEQQRQQEAVRAGVPGAGLRAYWAMQDFDNYATAATDHRASSARPGRVEASERAFAAAQYASVWSEYFTTPAGDEARPQVLDWLTSRSLDNVDVLRAYHEDFVKALRHACG